jgi:hypothetical protein
VVDLSSDEEDVFHDTSWDEDFARRLFGDLNCSLLGPPGDGKAIILSNSNEEDEVREEDSTNAEAVPPSTVKFPALTASTADASKGTPDDSNDGRSPD